MTEIIEESDGVGSGADQYSYQEKSYKLPSSWVPNPELQKMYEDQDRSVTRGLMRMLPICSLSSPPTIFLNTNTKVPLSKRSSGHSGTRWNCRSSFPIRCGQERFGDADRRVSRTGQADPAIRRSPDTCTGTEKGSLNRFRTRPGSIPTALCRHRRGRRHA